MPQLAQLSLVYSSQWFWLILTLGIIYFLVGHGIVPKVEKTVDDRNAQIERDLAAAKAARDEADQVEAAYRARMDASRGEATKLTVAAKEKGSKATEQSLAAAGGDADTKVNAALDRIRASRTAALAEIESSTAELVGDIVTRVAGFTPSRDGALKALREVTNG